MNRWWRKCVCAYNLQVTNNRPDKKKDHCWSIDVSFFVLDRNIQLHLVSFSFFPLYDAFDSLIFSTASWYFISFQHFLPWKMILNLSEWEKMAWFYFSIVLWQSSKKKKHKNLLLFVHIKKKNIYFKKGVEPLKISHTTEMNTSIIVEIRNNLLMIFPV